MLIINKFNKM